MQLITNLKKQPLKPLYVVVGTESYIVDEVLQAIKGHFDEEERQFNVATYDLEEMPIDVVVDEAETFPFMGEKKCVIARNALFLTGEKLKSKVEHTTERLEQYANTPDSFAVVVLIVPAEKMDERKKIVKTLKKQAVIIEAKSLEERELKQWISEMAQDERIIFDEVALDLLITLTNGDLSVIAKEVEKLALYVGAGGRVNSDAVTQLVPRTLEQNVFLLTEYIAARRMKEALLLLNDLWTNQEEPIKLLAILVGQIRLMLQVKYWAEQSYSQQQIASLAKVHPFRVKKAMGQIRLFRKEQLARMLDQCAEMDLHIKSGKIDKFLALEMLLLKWRG